VTGWVTSYAAIAAGELDVISDTVSRRAGHSPLGLAEYLHRHPEDLLPLRR
jgi:NAD(P)H dehydrogenase (quinone)